MSDNDLMERYKKGDFSAFKILYEKYSQRVYSFLKQRLNNPQDADELLQAVFLKFHHTRSFYDPKYSVLNWIFVITRTALIDFYRKNRKKGQQIVDDFPIDQIPDQIDEETPAEHTEQIAQTVDLLRQLSTEQRRVVEMRFLDELTYQQIAKQIGKSEVSIRQAISRAIRKLKLVTKFSGGAL